MKQRVSRDTCIIPIGLWKCDSRMTALNTCTVDQDVYVSTHGLESPREEATNLVKILEVAVKDSGGCPARFYTVIGLGILSSTCWWRTLYKANICASLCKSDGTSRTNSSCCTCYEDVGCMKVE